MIGIYSAWCSGSDEGWTKNKWAYDSEGTDNFLIIKEGADQAIDKNKLTPKEIKDWCFKKSDLLLLMIKIRTIWSLTSFVS